MDLFLLYLTRRIASYTAYGWRIKVEHPNIHVLRR